jgi:hypothetical protein
MYVTSRNSRVPIIPRCSLALQWVEWQLLQVNILVQYLPCGLSDLFSYMTVHAKFMLSRQSGVRHLLASRLTRDYTSTLSPFNFRSNQILDVETSVIHYNTIMSTDSANLTVFRVVGVISGDEETYVKDLDRIVQGML